MHKKKKIKNYTDTPLNSTKKKKNDELEKTIKQI